ncbi:beta-N-acetylhexosaminidase [Winogradskya consettensis]|uniref:beta-N-acetylhexosaminidase n=1 Tax=Winogradskya consettensis TaxID=113560 RepID=A0A919SH92_9ACTN|nr:beta-N-acetylhexosaminidase [Actinoplanes consettensis]
MKGVAVTRGLGDVIPAPGEVRPDTAADFTIDSGTRISAAAGTEDVAEHLAAALRPATGYGLPIGGAGLDAGAVTSGVIALVVDAALGSEAYRMEISPGGILLTGGDPAGVFYGVQTLRQLLPAEIYAGVPQQVTWTVPGGTISDRPRFSYRSGMLDVARHFFTVAEAKSYLDTLVQFKINHLHLHLTDDQGWRIEIDSWPKLTAISGGEGTGVDGVGPGFYTKADYSELVAYAAARFVTIVPEIDMPGHVNAAQVAYPELTTDGIAPEPRTDVEVGYSSLVAAKKETYTFADDVLREIAALTPGPYIHIGGDEALVTTAEDYRTFIERLLPLVVKHGKRPLGWHEMASADLPPTTIVQYWRIEATDDGTARAAAAGHKVIMSPADRTYLDMKYAADTTPGLDWAGLVSIEQAYGWDPADRLPGVTEDSLLGVEAPLWSETLRTLADAQTMTFPRLPAIAEIGWSPRETHNWESFRTRLAACAPRWRAQGVAFHPAPEINWPH